ncbi:hypothetical protein BH09ACT12_BH09ACT12_02470 [soil metagenome]
MFLPLLIGFLAAGILLATAASKPATDSSRQRTAARRAKFVATHPTHVNSADIVAALRSDGVAPEQARFITDHAVAQGIKPFTMWLWLEQFDAQALSIVVAADLTHRELLTHISNGTVPDLDELRLFASANGLEIAGPPVPSKKRAVPSVKAKKRPPMPPIFEPGSFPALAGQARPLRVDLGENGGLEGGRGDLAA